MKNLKLGILDQSIVSYGGTAAEALAETIATARLAEDLGYHRFWVSEHHNSTFIAGSSPELLMVKLATETERIRIGSGGIMLPNHSALKVAENFRMLEALFPGRIDLGMGRAPGGDRITASLLNPSNTFRESDYLRQLEHLQHFFHDTAGTAHGSILAVPQATTVPQQWILSSSGGSSLIAARFGMGLAVARFINSDASPDIAATYRDHFQPSAQFPEPRVILSIGVLCAETEEKAAAMRKFIDYVYLQFEKGKFHDFGDPEYIRDYQFSEAELLRLSVHAGRVVSGTPEQVKKELVDLSEQFGADELMITTMSDNATLRRRSFELLAEILGLRSS